MADLWSTGIPPDILGRAPGFPSIDPRTGLPAAPLSAGPTPGNLAGLQPAPGPASKGATPAPNISDTSYPMNQQGQLLATALQGLQQQYGQAQLLQPGLFNLAGVTPQAGGGYAIAPTESNPQLLRDWGMAEQNLTEKLRKQWGPGWETSTGAARTMQDFQASKMAALEQDRRQYEAQRMGEITGISNFPYQMGAQTIGGLAQGWGDISRQISQQQTSEQALQTMRDQIKAQQLSGIFSGVGSILGGAIGRGGMGGGGGLSGSGGGLIGDILGIPGALYKGVTGLGDLFGLSGGSLASMFAPSAPATLLPSGALSTSAPEILSGIGSFSSASAPAAGAGAAGAAAGSLTMADLGLVGTEGATTAASLGGAGAGAGLGAATSSALVTLPALIGMLNMQFGPGKGGAFEAAYPTAAGSISDKLGSGYDAARLGREITGIDTTGAYTGQLPAMDAYAAYNQMLSRAGITPTGGDMSEIMKVTPQLAQIMVRENRWPTAAEITSTQKAVRDQMAAAYAAERAAGDWGRA